MIRLSLTRKKGWEETNGKDADAGAAAAAPNSNAAANCGIQIITTAKHMQTASLVEAGGLHPNISTTITAMSIAHAMGTNMRKQQISRAAATSRITVWMPIAML